MALHLLIMSFLVLGAHASSETNGDIGVDLNAMYKMYVDAYVVDAAVPTFTHRVMMRDHGKVNFYDSILFSLCAPHPRLNSSPNDRTKL